MKRIRPEIHKWRRESQEHKIAQQGTKTATLRGRLGFFARNLRPSFGRLIIRGLCALGSLGIRRLLFFYVFGDADRNRGNRDGSIGEEDGSELITPTSQSAGTLHHRL